MSGGVFVSYLSHFNRRLAYKQCFLSSRKMLNMRIHKCPGALIAQRLLPRQHYWFMIIISRHLKWVRWLSSELSQPNHGLSDFRNKARTAARRCSSQHIHVEAAIAVEGISAYQNMLLESPRTQNATDMHHLRGMPWPFMQVSDCWNTSTYRYPGQVSTH